MASVDLVADIYDYYAGEAPRLLADRDIPVLSGSGRALLRKCPIGTVLGIMPWNFPYYQIARFAAPNLLAGNGVLLKPAPQCPDSALAVQEIAADAGVPASVYSTLFVDNAQIESIIGHAGVRGVSFTGVGDPRDPGTELGPVSSEAAAQRLERQIRDAVADGVTVLIGGGRQGAFVEPTVLADVDPANRAYTEEFFGPVALVYRASDDAHAVEIANDTPYGLGSYVFGRDPDRARSVADRIDAGMVYVNGVFLEGPELPFGGTKASGFGRELGPLGIDEFVNTKLVRIAAEDGRA